MVKMHADMELLTHCLYFQLEGQMKDNLAVIKTNCDSLDSRIKSIQK